MVCAGIDNIGQQPVQQLPADQREVGAGHDRRHQPLRPLQRHLVGQSLEYAVLEERHHDGYAEPLLILHVIGGVQGAANGTALAVSPIQALDQLVSQPVRPQLREYLLLFRLAAVIRRQHFGTPFFPHRLPFAA